jgi:hypothetical protein
MEVTKVGTAFIKAGRRNSELERNAGGSGREFGGMTNKTIETDDRMDRFENEIFKSGNTNCTNNSRI